MACQSWVISGRVQGVGYRAWMREKAEALGIDGWVRNRADGVVEAVVQGEEAMLDRLRQACLRGPSFASVAGIAVSDCAARPTRSGFEQRPDA